MKLNTIAVLVLILTVSATGVALAAVPRTLNVQGVLQQPGGSALPDGEYAVVFGIYGAESGGTALWEETHSVAVENGLFQAVLGSLESLDLDFDSPYFIGLTVDGDEMLPRIRLTANAYALMARTVEDAAVTTAKLNDAAVTGAKMADGSVSSSQLADGTVVRSINGLSDAVILAAGDNVFLTQEGDSLVIAAPGGGGGDITAVLAGIGLTGGGLIGEVTLSIAPDGVTADLLADDAISNGHVAADAAIAESKLALDFPTHDDANDPSAGEKAALAGTQGTPSDGNRYVTDSDPRLLGSGGPPSGPAGGDLNGSYPNPSLDPDAAVVSLNNLSGALILQGTGGAAVSTVGDTIKIAAAGGSGSGGISAIQNTDSALSISDPTGPTTTINVAPGGLSNTHVAADAAIAESKLDLTYSTHSNTNDPTSDQKAALAGTDGTPSTGNPYVTDSDPRLQAGAFADSLFWKLGGNVITKPETEFLGTVSGSVLEVRVDASRALRFERRVGDQTDGTSVNLLGGDSQNNIAEGVIGGTVGGGGRSNSSDNGPNLVTSHYSTVAGGAKNWAGPDSEPENGMYATVGGGHNNSANEWAATIAGGEGNVVGDSYGTVGGGTGNRAGLMATVPGGNENEALGNNSFAAGLRARVREQDSGTFVWADGVDQDFMSTGENQFLIRADGGVGIGTNAPQAQLHLGGTPGVDGIMFPDGTLQTTAAAGGSAGWSLTGNAGTDTTVNFLGTTDSEPLHLKVNNELVYRFFSGNMAGQPNVVGGAATNSVNLATRANTVAGGWGNRAGGTYSTVGGGDGNQVLESGDNSTIGGGGKNLAIGSIATIGGGFWNKAASTATVSGGFQNEALGSASGIGGGESNLSPGAWSRIGGGKENRAYGAFTTIGGGGSRSGTPGNRAFDNYGTIAGGAQNEAGSDNADSLDAQFASVGGGNANKATEAFTTVSGGNSNQAVANGATIGGGGANEATGEYATIGGGDGNRAEGAYATVAGGGRIDQELQDTENRATDDWTFVGGGGANLAGTDDADPSNAEFAVVVGGEGNQATQRNAFVGGGERNTASGRHSVISGGEDNTASSSFAVIAGGALNEAGFYSVIGGGIFNRAVDYSVVGGGNRNHALGGNSIVLGGTDNFARGAYSAILSGGNASFGDTNSVSGNWGVIVGGRRNEVVNDYGVILGGADNVVDNSYGIAGGRNNRAGFGSVAIGGEFNEATGSQSWALGRRAKALNQRCFVWGSKSFEDFISTKQEQFLVRADGGFGIGTNDTPEALNVLEPSGSTGIRLGGGGTAGPHGIIFEDETANTGLQLFFRTDPNRLVLERSSAGTETDGADAFYYDRDDEHFVFNGQVAVAAGINAAASFTNHIARFNNTAGGSADVMSLRANVATPGGGNNFITFFGSGANGIGAIEGDGAGGVTFKTSGADYAEWLRRENPEQILEPGTVVGVHGGLISLRTDGADHVMVVSTAPIVLGNCPPESEQHAFTKVAFLGQVPVHVYGTVQTGDCLIASGRADGSAVAVAPARMTPAAWTRFLGVAWEGSTGGERTMVNATVGLSAAGAIAQSQQAVIDSLEARLEGIEERLARVEGRVADTERSEE